MGIKGVWNYITELFLAIWQVLKSVGRIYLRQILKFAQDVVSFFKDPKRWRLLKSNKDILPIVLKQKLNNGDYNVVSCLFDEKKEEVVDIEESEGYECERLDYETASKFGNKDMLVLG